MKTLLTFLLTASISVAQTVSPAAKDGSNITSPGQWKANLSFLQAADVSGLYAPLANPTFTGTVSGITKGMVGLGNVDNTSDTNKPISSATQTALDAKQSTLGYTPQRVVNVKDFGAVGNGVTDDTQAIQAAALSIGDGTGGILYFPKGTYLLVNSTATGTGSIPWGASAYGGTTSEVRARSGPRPTLQLFSHIAVQGDGIGVTILKAADSNPAQPFINLSATTGVSFRDLTIDGNRQRLDTPYNNSETELIDTKDFLVNLTFERVRFVNGSQEAIDIELGSPDANLAMHEAATLFVRDCQFEDIGGAALHGLSWARVERCTFKNCNWNRWRDSDDGVLTGAEGQGVMDGAFEKVIIRDCEVYDSPRAIHLFRNLAVGATGAATGYVTATSNPTAGSTVVINGRTYTFGPVAKPVTALASTDVFTCTGHGWSDGQAVQIIQKSQAGGGAPVDEWVTYYVRDATANTFKLAETNGGAAIDISVDLVASSYVVALADVPTGDQIPIFATRAETVQNLGLAINGFAWGSETPNSHVRATWATPSSLSGTPDILNFRALIQGAPGNAITLAVTGTGLTRSAETLTGGGALPEKFLRVEDCYIENTLPDAQAAIILGDGATDAVDVVISGVSYRGDAVFLANGKNVTLHGCNLALTSNRYASRLVISLGDLNMTNCTISGGTVVVDGPRIRIVSSDIRSPYGAIVSSNNNADDIEIIGCYLATSGNLVDGGASNLTTVDLRSTSQTGNSLIGCRVVGVASNACVRLGADCTASGNNLSGGSVAFHLHGSNNTLTGNRSTLSASWGAGTVQHLAGNAFGTLPLDGLVGSGSPEGVVAAPVGSTYRRTDGGAGTSHYFKESGTGNTGWVAK